MDWMGVLGSIEVSGLGPFFPVIGKWFQNDLHGPQTFFEFWM